MNFNYPKQRENTFTSIWEWRLPQRSISLHVRTSCPFSVCWTYESVFTPNSHECSKGDGGIIIKQIRYIGVGTAGIQRMVVTPVITLWTHHPIYITFQILITDLISEMMQIANSTLRDIYMCFISIISVIPKFA